MQFNPPSDFTQISIGIQARSASKRFPRKIFEMLGEKMIIQHVYDSCMEGVTYLNRQSHRNRTNMSVFILCPTGDEISNIYTDNVIEGSEENVLERYLKLQADTKADFVVRVTADCPLLPSYLISKVINLALKNHYDYCSNVQESVRTSVDGFDVEVMSKRALEWLSKNANTKEEKEHVTLALRSPAIPREFRIGHVIGHLSLSHLKLSVDTKEDLERVREEYSRIRSAIKAISKLPGQNQIHRY